MSDPYKLPSEVNTKIEANEMNGEYICKGCKGWGYIVQGKKAMGGLTSAPINICPECGGTCITDWVRRARQGGQ